MKRPFSLLEVVVALSLTAILLTTLFSCYRHLILSKEQIKKSRTELYPFLFTQARLTQVFNNLEEGRSFYTEEGVLTFEFDYGIDRKPKYCGFVEAKLFVDDHHRLILKINDKREEVLQKEITDYSISFFDLKKKDWRDEWEGTLLPAQVRLHFGKKEMTFSIPNVVHMVVYP